MPVKTLGLPPPQISNPKQLIQDTPPQIHPYTPTPLHKYTHTPLHKYTPTPLHKYTLTPLHEYTPTPIHPYTNTPLHQDIQRGLRADGPNFTLKNSVMKNLFKTISAVCFAAGLLFAGCCKDNDAPTSGTAKVHVSVDDFSIAQEEFGMKSPTDVADYTGVKAITLAFYKTSDGTEQYKVTQIKDNMPEGETFGHFDLSLPMGNYTMVVLGYGLNNNEPAITLTSPTSATFGDNPARETFAATQEVNITNANEDVDISATLSRVISKLEIYSTDPRTENAQNVRITFSAGGKSFSPTTGLATANTGFINTLAIQAVVGNVASFGSYLFLATDEQSMNITIDVLDANGNSIAQKVVNNVPFQRNRKTKLTGSLFSAGGEGSFQVETAWLTDHNINF